MPTGGVACPQRRRACPLRPLNRNPTVRITIHESAKRKLSTLVAQIRAEAGGRGLDEGI